jgi:hypothetical protein
MLRRWRQQRSVQVLIKNRSWQHWALCESQPNNNVVVQNVYPLHAGRQVNILEKSVITDIEEDMIVGVDFK